MPPVPNSEPGLTRGAAPSWARRAGLVLLALTAAAYLPVLAAGFVWDDKHLVVGNQLISTLDNLPLFFQVDLWESTALADTGSGFYRPLVLLSLAIDHALTGSAPAFSHLHSLAWHLLACALLWRLLRRTLGPVGAAAGLPLFALHPAQVEAVAWVSARNDPMAAALIFGALLLLERDRPSAAELAAGGGLVLAAMLSKESALLAPVLLGLVATARTGRPGRLVSHVAVLAALGVYLLLRTWAEVPAPPRADLAHIRAAVPPSLAHYAHLALWPVDLAPGLHLAWPPPVPWVALGLGLVGAGGLIGLGRGSAAAGLAFGACTLAPALGAVASQGLVADRYLYLPLAGLALAVGAAFHRAGPALLLCLTMALGGAMTTSLQVRIWNGSDSLWAAAVSRHPSPWVYGVVARELDLDGRKDEAVEWYRRATAPPKPMIEACYRVAWVSLDRGQPDDVIADGQAALDAGCPPEPELLAPMAVALALRGDWDQAELAAIQVVPDPTGLSTIVEVAAGARRGELGPLRVAIDEHPELPSEGLYRRVSWLLDQAGEPEASRQVLLHGVAAGHLPVDLLPEGG